jgi:hypothetical protein
MSDIKMLTSIFGTLVKKTIKKYTVCIENIIFYILKTWITQSFFIKKMYIYVLLACVLVCFLKQFINYFFLLIITAHVLKDKLESQNCI